MLYQGTPTPGSVGAYPQRLCLDAACEGMPQAELSRDCPCWEMDNLRSRCACLRPLSQTYSPVWMPSPRLRVMS